MGYLLEEGETTAPLENNMPQAAAINLLWPRYPVALTKT